MDLYYQDFSREGFAVPLGQLAEPEWPVCDKQFLLAYGDALNIATDPSRLVKSIELRATCCEGVIGLAGLPQLKLGRGGSEKTRSRPIVLQAFVTIAAVVFPANQTWSADKARLSPEQEEP